jgi:hypothetical protein
MNNYNNKGSRVSSDGIATAYGMKDRGSAGGRDKLSSALQPYPSRTNLTFVTEVFRYITLSECFISVK